MYFFEGVPDSMDTLYLLFIGGWYDSVVKSGSVCGQVSESGSETNKLCCYQIPSFFLGNSRS